VTQIDPVDDVPAAFARTVIEAFVARTGERFTLVLSGGPTAKLCYEHLADVTLGEGDGNGGDGNGDGSVGSSGATGATDAGSGTVPTAHPAFDWSVIDIYMGDERIVPPDDDDANQRLVREAIVDRVGVIGSFNPMPTEGPVDECVASYQRTMAAVLAGPGIDLIHLGMGPDGHTASLFPNAPTLQAPADELVAATQDPNGVNAHPRLTVTFPVIDSARCAVFTVAGESKQGAIAALRRGDDVPAARVKAVRIVWLVDRVAAGGSASTGDSAGGATVG
jgi:6-phosphogluconolactonase